MQKYKQGDIILIPYPYTDLSHVKQRPAVIISNNTINHPDYIVAKITSVERNDVYTFKIGADSVNKPLKRESEVRTHEVFTVHHSIIKKSVATFKKEYLKKLIEKVRSNF